MAGAGGGGQEYGRRGAGRISARGGVEFFVSGVETKRGGDGRRGSGRRDPCGGNGLQVGVQVGAGQRCGKRALRIKCRRCGGAGRIGARGGGGVLSVGRGDKEGRGWSQRKCSRRSVRRGWVAGGCAGWSVEQRCGKRALRIECRRCGERRSRSPGAEVERSRSPGGSLGVVVQVQRYGQRSEDVFGEAKA